MKAPGNSPGYRNWRPTAPNSVLKERARLLSVIRDFFKGRHVLEVETPVMVSSPVPDSQIDSISAGDRFLHTSPEYHMKRLLAAGSGAIYQVCKVFRKGEAGSRHNPEFSMLEWYRPGFELSQLMGEVYELLLAAGLEGEQKVSCWSSLVKEKTGIDAFNSTERQICNQLQKLSTSNDPASLSRSEALSLLFSELVEPGLGRESIEFVTGYPSWEPSLAVHGKDAGGNVIANRFEIFVEGVELGNAYQEEWDAGEIRKRFESSNKARMQIGKPAVELDEKFLSSLESYDETCAGVSIGLDRLLMILLEENHIGQVISFPADQA